MEYWTPGLTTGITLSFVGIAGLVTLLIFDRKNRTRDTAVIGPHDRNKKGASNNA